jgi:DNA adenine methylase
MASLESYVPGQQTRAVVPLLKWTGGKRQILKHLLPLLPVAFRKYYEPFLGGGALFFALRPRISFLADRNPDLINCYTQVRDHPREVISALREWPNTEEDYYAVRGLVPADPIEQAARTIYLTRLAFNGIYRLNAKGEFNVPYGYRTHLNPCEPHRIKVISKALKKSVLLCEDFEASIDGIRRGDVVYFDPPYAGPKDRTRFVRYNDRNFTWEDQIRLAGLARRLRDRGVAVLVSNAADVEITELYEGFSCYTLNRNSSVAADGAQRGPTAECIFYNLVP